MRGLSVGFQIDFHDTRHTAHPKTTCIVNDTADSSADVSTTFEGFEYLFAPKIIGIDAVVAANPHQLIALFIAQGTHKLR